MSAPPETELSAIERERMILRHGLQQDPRTMRIAGFISMALGLVLIMIIGAVAYHTVPLMLADGETIDGSRFTGGTGAKLAIFLIYAAVAAVGFTVMLTGALHIVTGKRFAPGLRLMSLFLTLVVGIGLLVKALA